MLTSGLIEKYNFKELILKLPRRNYSKPFTNYYNYFIYRLIFYKQTNILGEKNRMFLLVSSNNATKYSTTITKSRSWSFTQMHSLSQLLA